MITFLFYWIFISKMTKTSSSRRPRTSKKNYHYRPRIVNIADLRSKPPAKLPSVNPTPSRVIYVQEPYYTQMLCGEKVVEVRPNYKKWRDLAHGDLVEFRHRYSGSSFLARITRKRVHRHVVHMLRAEGIKSCLPYHDSNDLQRAVNTYYSFCNGMYRTFFKKHGVMSFRFTRVDPDTTPPDPKFGDYDKKSLCSIFEAVNRSFTRPNKYNRKICF